MRWRLAAIVVWLLIGLPWGLNAPISSVANAQQAPLEIFLTQFNYDEVSNTYYVLVSITDTAQVGQIDPRLLDLQTGEDIRFGDLVPVTSAELSFRLGTEQLQPGRKYKLALRAFQPGSTTTYIRRPTQNAAENPLVFASQEFAYNPPQAVPIIFSVDGVNADFARHTLQIAMHHSDTVRPLRWEAVIVDKRGSAVGRAEQPTLVLKNGIAEAPLPAAIEQADQPAEYHLTLRLFATDNNKLVGEQRKDFTLPAPPKPNVIERLGVALETYPWLSWSLAAIGVCLVAAFLIRMFWPRKPKPLPRPQNLEPVYLRAPSPQPAASPVIVAPPDPSLSDVEVVAPPGGEIRSVQPSTQAPAWTRTPATVAFDDVTCMLVVTSEGGAGREHVLRNSEISVGRAENNDIVIDDEYVSRRHATIARQDGSYSWSDRDGVTKATQINGEALVGPHTLHDGDTIEVGRTVLVFRVPAREPTVAV